MNHVLWTSILIGLALFLFGIDYLSLSLQELSPTRLKNLLSKCTSSTFKAILIGCFITCIIQSSSATTALTVSLINANLMTFSQSIGIIMGANIGTTITAFIVGFDLFQYASFFLIIGAFCLLFSNHPKIKGLAQILFGLGCLFYGLELMSLHLEAITKLPEFIQKIVEKLFNNNVLSLFSFKHDYDPEERKANQEFVRKHNLFNKREMKIPQNEKLIRLNNIARKQMELLKNNKSFNNLEYIENKVNNKQTLPL